MQVRREQLTILRQQAGLTKKGLAEMAGVSKAAIGQMESGRHGASEDTIWRITKVLESRLGREVGVGDIAVLGQPQPVADAS